MAQESGAFRDFDESVLRWDEGMNVDVDIYRLAGELDKDDEIIAGVESIPMDQIKAFHTKRRPRKFNKYGVLEPSTPPLQRRPPLSWEQEVRVAKPKRRKNQAGRRKHRKKTRNRTRVMPLDDDLFIEPAGDYDVVYGDYNATMEDGAGKRPYIRLNSNLPNVTRHTGGEVRLKCEAVGSPQPITFTWLKNHAPIEKSRKVRVRNREFWSKLVIMDLDVLDSGYYQCTAANLAGSVNTTSVLRVNTAPPNAKPKPAATVGKHSKTGKDALLDYNDDYGDYLEEGDRARMKSDLDDLFKVPDAAGGAGYVPMADADVTFNERWLDGRQLHAGDCVPYMGRACRAHLAGRQIMLPTADRDELYDVDHHISAAMMFIQKMANVSEQCKRYSHAVACYHRYKVCDGNSETPMTATPAVVPLCRRDCDELRATTCAAEFAMAAQHELVGDGPKSLLPRCETIPADSPHCIRVLQPEIPQVASPTFPGDATSEGTQFSHWCYVDTGRKYEGNVAQTVSGKVCLPWKDSPSADFHPNADRRLRTAGNHCRNPGGPIAQPWCYAAPTGLPEPCDIRKCPPHFYPDFGDSAPDPSATLLSDLSRHWTGMGAQTQLATACGLGALLLTLIACLCCACFCGRKRTKSASSATTATSAGAGHSTVTSSMLNAKNGYFMQSMNGGSSIANSAVNAQYYGNRGPMLSAAPPLNNYEMNSLLQARAPGSAVHSIGSHAYAQAQPMTHLQQAQLQQSAHLQQHQQAHLQQPHGSALHLYSPHTSTEPSEQSIQIIAESQLSLDQPLGEDSRELVYTGTHTHANGFDGRPKQLKVAVKMPQLGASQLELQAFREEVRQLALFEHLNVIRLLGVTYVDNNTRLAAVFDYDINGNLVQWLKMREPRGNELEEERCRNYEDMCRIAAHIAGGMEYLAKQGYVHRDLAARNCLIANQVVVKIADFAKYQPQFETDYCVMAGPTKLPIRWMAREAFDGACTEQTDVYSFGVTLWEVYTFAQQPYAHQSNQEVLDKLGFRDVLQCPPGCPTKIYGMIVECCNEHADRRPGFAELHQRLQMWSALGHATYSARASSVHSGGSSGGGSNGMLLNNGFEKRVVPNGNGSGEQFGMVPSPAPNTGHHHLAKLAVLPNGHSIMHSTPVGRRSPRSRAAPNSVEPTEDTSPLMRRKRYDPYSSESEED